MFDKEAYWRDKKSPLPSPTAPKISKKQPGDKHFAPGEHMARMQGRGFILVNRKTARQRSPSRAGSKPIKPRSSIDRHKDFLITMGKLPATQRPPAEFKHTVNKPRQSEHPYPPLMSNRERMQFRRDQRKQAAEAKRKAREAADAKT